MAGWPEKLFWNFYTVWHAHREGRLPAMPLDRIMDIQNRRVMHIIRHAYASTPYYRRVMDERGLKPADFRTAADLEKLPVLTGDQLASDPDQFLSKNYRPGTGLALHSTGTTGRKKIIHQDRSSVFLSLATGQRQRIVLAEWVGRKFGYREMTVGDPHGAAVQMRRFYETHSWVPKSVDLQRDAIFATEEIEDNLEKMNRFQPDVIFGLGSYIGYLFRWAWDRGLPFHHPKAIWYGADLMSDSHRSFLEEEVGIPVYSTYQAAEAPRIAYQCELRRGFHINMDQVAVRIVDAEGNTLGPGERGEIIISNLTNHATILLNYKLGDIVTLSSHACTCGRTLPTLEQIDGRADDWILRPDRSRIHSYSFIRSLQNVPGVEQVQMVQEAMHRFRLRIVPSVHAERSKMDEGLRSVLYSILGKEISMEIETVDSLPGGAGGKVKAVICQVKE
jgi:phenylacetate-CoA ligase